MLTVDRDVFEKAVLQVLASQETEQLLTEFSLNRVFFYSLLNDVSMGKDSSNYQVRSSAKEPTNVATVNKGKHGISNTKKTSKEAPRGISYLVKEGDTLWGATRYKTSLDDIKTMNNLTSNSLKTGKVLIVPRSQNTVGKQGVETNRTEQESKEKEKVNEVQTSKERENALTISIDSDIKTIETKPQGNVREEIHKEEKVLVHKREEAEKEANHIHSGQGSE